jgi:hypothetical protein
MTLTPRHGLPLLDAGQAQKEVTHNEALLAIDTRLHSAVETRGLAEPPSDPLSGASYIVPEGASDAWTGKRDMIANWDGFGWRFSIPTRGWLAWIADEAVFSVYDAGWSAGGWPVDGLRVAGRSVLSAPPASVSSPAGGGVVDNECRTAVAELLSALRNQGLVL